MSIHEIPSSPQIVMSEGQGLTGTRQWIVGSGEDVVSFMQTVCESHFPGFPDCLPVEVRVGPQWEGNKIYRPSQRYYENMGSLPSYNSYLVNATYALQRLTNCWPTAIPKPAHRAGTAMSLRVRGSGQMLLITAAGARGAATPLMLCNDQIARESFTASLATRVAIPTAEYHITCDRITPHQLNLILGPDRPHRWDKLLGCVNMKASRIGFLGHSPETLLFDGYELAETFVPNIDSPRRYRLTAILKSRVIMQGEQQVKDTYGNIVGWNHDFTNLKSGTWGWTYIKIENGKLPGSNLTNCVARYTPAVFEAMFTHWQGNMPPAEVCGDGERGTMTPMYDDDFCVQTLFGDTPPGPELRTVRRRLKQHPPWFGSFSSDSSSSAQSSGVDALSGVGSLQSYANSDASSSSNTDLPEC